MQWQPHVATAYTASMVLPPFCFYSYYLQNMHNAKYKYSLFCYLVFLTGQLKSQILAVNIEAKFDSALEISSSVCRGDSLFLIPEKCKQIFIIKKEGFAPSDNINLDRGILSKRSVEIEGATLYRDHLLMSDEKNAKIYDYAFLDDSISEVTTNHDLSNDTGSYGMEGIAVDTVDNICYVLKEKNGNNQSVIHVFQITDTIGIALHFIKDIFIEQLDNSWRYSDLCYNYKDQYLYCLKTKFGIYQIDIISTRFNVAEGLITIPLSQQKLFMDISANVNKNKLEGFNTNMEGIAIDDESIYVVSDNAQEAEANCNALGEGKTLLLKIMYRNN